jgi:hypothetical protein
MRAYVCLFALPLLAQEPLPIQMLPPESTLIVGINVAGIRTSKLAQSAISQIKAQAPELAGLAAAGFDPLNTIDEVLLGATEGSAGRGMALLRGQCGPERLAAFAPKGAKSASSQIGGTKLLSFQSRGQQVAATCLSTDVFAVGTAGMVKSALARRAAPRGPAVALAERAAAMRGAHDLWIVAKADFSKVAADVPNPQAAAMMKSDIAKSIQEIAFGLKLSDGLALSTEVTTRTGNDAEMLAGALMMMAGMAKSDPKAKQMAPVLDQLNVRAEGNVMRASLALSEEQLALIGKQAQAAAQTATPQPAPPASNDIVIHSSPRDMGTVTLPAPK